LAAIAALNRHGMPEKQQSPHHFPDPDNSNFKNAMRDITPDG
jgi:hypothetical protein